MSKNIQTDTEIVDDFIHTIRGYFQTSFTGYDTYIDRENIKEHLISLINGAVTLNGKIDAIADIANGDF